MPSGERSAAGTRSSMLLGRHAGSPRRRWIVVGLGLLLLANAVVAVVALAGLGTNPSSGSSKNPSPAAQPLASATASSSTAARTPPGVVSAVQWMAQTLPKTVVVLADAQVGDALRAQGFSAVRPVTGATSTPAAGVVVSTPQLRAAATNSAIDAAVRSAIPLAVVGSGGSQITVAQLSRLSAAELATHRAADAGLRKSSEPELLANPAVRVDSGAAAVLRAGALDLRAATVLAQMASIGAVHLRAVVGDAAEQRAGLPARVVELTATPFDEQSVYLRGLNPPYRPAAQQSLSGGVLRLTWSLRPDPTDISR
ncbi:hypothetical protein [uncultured Jatrophihabitans sp.]|uniref:hypothetical protein n=1 Tax=uncultured Jatrophihabitans sp. TaxID=1610747 RepID=UPI0035C9E76C